MFDFDIIANEEEMGKMAKEYAKLRLAKQKTTAKCTCEGDGDAYQEAILQSVAINLYECAKRAEFLSQDSCEQCKINRIMCENAILIGKNESIDLKIQFGNRNDNRRIFIVKLKRVLLDLAQLSYVNDNARKALIPLLTLYSLYK